MIDVGKCEMSVRQTADEIETDAARWVMRLDREGQAPALTADLEAWLAGDVRRAGALLQAEAAWALLDRGRMLNHGERGASRRHRPVQLGRRQLLIGGGAAIAAGVVGLVAYRPSTDHYGTALGEIRRVPLADGSTVAINTASTVDIELAPKLRRVRLDKGEAWFQVAKDPSRPFLVEAGAVRVQAVGTAFSVRRRDGGAEVLVTEGVVKVWATSAAGQVTRLAAGERAFVADNAAVSETAAEPSEVDRQLAWRAGKIDLAGETLGQAVTEFNRYNARSLVVADAALSGERLYGIFRIDDPEGFAQAVASSLGASVSLSDPTRVVIGGDSGMKTPPGSEKENGA